MGVSIEIVVNLERENLVKIVVNLERENLVKNHVTKYLFRVSCA